MSSSVKTRKAKTVVAQATCFRLIYRSRSLLAEDSEDPRDGLSEILKESRTNNAAQGITGALVLYEYKQRFAQVLEGDENSVMALFQRIEADTRHEGVEVCEAAHKPNHLFSRWAMALVLEHQQADVPLMATHEGIGEAAPWRVSDEQELVLNQLRDLTRGYGRSY